MYHLPSRKGINCRISPSVSRHEECWQPAFLLFLLLRGGDICCHILASLLSVETLCVAFPAFLACRSNDKRNHSRNSHQISPTLFHITDFQMIMQFKGKSSIMLHEFLKTSISPLGKSQEVGTHICISQYP